ncbi:MAG TPA: xanthine dehydrogenase family protein molybdopterin-binding subunit [Caulobacteraceae bacterium]|nr:xanthine dehydrogenase family protein molybdopterin-binding subunit [Caulobacteraceae bacterium]
MNRPVKDFEPTRRALLVAAAVTATGSLLVGCGPADILALGAPKLDWGPFGPFIRIDPDGSVTVVNKHIEFGQGSHAGLAAIVAEELDADWDKVKVVQAPANAKIYANLMMGVQGTGGSSAISNSWNQLRTAGAAARAMFTTAASAKLGAPAAELTVKDGVVSHAATGRQATFAELLPLAAKVKPPQSPTLKALKDFTLIGTDRVRRKDSTAKSTGTAQFTQDVHLPNMLTAMVAHPPVFGAKPKSFDAAAARQVAGVEDVFVIPTGVAVTAKSTWAARKGRAALNVQWDQAKAETRGSDELMAFYRKAAASAEATPGVKWQPFEKRPAPATSQPLPLVAATYDFPFLAHAPMEPMNCVAEIGGGKTKLTVGSQAPSVDQLNTALIVGCLPGDVEIEQLYAGGSFGRRTNFKSDYVAECVHIAKHVGGGRPVKLVWTREDDMTAGYYRPLTHHNLQVQLGADGLPWSWTHRVVTQSIMKGSPMPSRGLDESAVEGAKGSPYFAATPYVSGEAALIDVGVPVLWWRSVGATHNAFVMEHTIDQLARKAGKDPVEYRRALYAKAGAVGARHLACLNLAAEKAPWGKPAEGYAQGVAVHESFGTVVAQIADVKLEDGKPRVGRVVTAIDCGIAISPDQIAAQMEGGTCLGLAAALYGSIDLKGGVVQQANFDGYRVLRMNEAPQVETYIVPSERPPSGVGEPGTPVIAPAVANALLTLTGKPTTALPLVKD